MPLRNLVCRFSLFAALGTGAVQANEIYPITDQQITQQVKRQISQHPELGSQLTVQTRKGIVYVGGTQWMRIALSNLEFTIREMEGVTAVVVTAIYTET
jgi:osmotically-inducible protein OsmY